MVWATAGMSLGRYALDSFYRYVGTYATLTAGDLDIEVEYLAKFGSIDAGTRVGVGIRVVDVTTGAASPLVNKLITVGA